MSIRVPILVYHHIYPDGSSELTRRSNNKATGVISESDFIQQMQHIKSGGWKSISTTRVVNWIDGIDHIPDKSIVIHFDNGWLESWTTAKTINITARSYSTSYDQDVHATRYWDGTGATHFHRPSLFLTALS